jgi:transposase
MPRKGDAGADLKPGQSVAKFIKRHYEGGESVGALAKEYKISRATGYIWLMKHRGELIEESRRKGASPETFEKESKAALIAEIQALNLENQKLRNKVVSLMMKHGEL